VLEELYAGARAGKMAALEKLERDFRTVRRVLAPDISDWVAAGRILGKIGAKYGFDQIGRGGKQAATLPAYFKSIRSSRLVMHHDGMTWFSTFL